MTKEKDHLFWSWCNERHRVYLKRAAGEPWPWSDDPLFNQFRFTNVFRDLDRGTRWYLTRMVPKMEEKKFFPATILYNTMAYRFFNRIETAEFMGLPSRRFLNADALRSRSRDCQIFTGAHMVCNEGLDGVVWVLQHVFTKGDAIVQDIVDGNSVRIGYERLRRLHHCGPFLAHQFVQDLRHTEVLRGAHDGETWSQAGPGCLRGLHEWLERHGDPLTEMLELWEDQDNWREPHLPRLEVKDIQQSLCELQKYMKMKREAETGKGCKRRVFDTPTRPLI